MSNFYERESDYSDGSGEIPTANFPAAIPNKEVYIQRREIPGESDKIEEQKKEGGVQL